MGALFCDASDFYFAPGSPAIPHEEIEELTQRNPIYAGWQQPQWRHHCGHGCAFLGAATSYLLKKKRGKIEPKVRDILKPKDEARFQQLYNSIDADTEFLIWIFRCRVCGDLLPHVDFP